MRTRTLTVALVATIALVVSGCGGSDGGGGGKDDDAVSDAARPYVDALKKSMTKTGDEDFTLTDKQASCMAPRFVNIVGVENLKDNKVSPEDFAEDDSLDFSKLKITEKEGNALYDTFAKCDVDLKKTIVDDLASDDEMTPAMVKCIEDVFTDDNLRKFIVTSMIKGDDAMENDPELSPIMDQMVGCAFMGMGEDE